MPDDNGENWEDRLGKFWKETSSWVREKTDESEEECHKWFDAWSLRNDSDTDEYDNSGDDDNGDNDNGDDDDAGDYEDGDGGEGGEGDGGDGGDEG